MARTPDDARRWAAEGTSVFLAAAATPTSAGYAAHTALPGWTRGHLVAHVAANADALRNLVHWAATGDVTPMYATPEERIAAIEWGSRLPAGQLGHWLRTSAARLQTACDQLRGEQWAHEVRTAQGRTVPASEIAWLRAREVWVHAADLGTGVAFADLPDDFLRALEADIVERRGAVPDVAGPLAERVAWLAGRPHALAGAPELDAWL
ncbi:maleylpyruvate isomerase family mycothiol-dependent enzyme [Pseudonocardia xishanensis]|uniref:Mycothiol-dependent maleylpyruvate isomerase metal-binding domain-containing protein n=1 Tax=Pseudonocardia xishanensis TaxID=630995 RepID=A0ABP8RU95_9PSEU